MNRVFINEASSAEPSSAQVSLRWVMVGQFAAIPRQNYAGIAHLLCLACALAGCADTTAPLEGGSKGRLSVHDKKAAATTPANQTETTASNKTIHVGKPGEFSALLPAGWQRVPLSDGLATFEKLGAGYCMRITVEKHGDGGASFRTPDDYLPFSRNFPFTKTGNLVVAGHPATRWRRKYEMPHPSEYDDGVKRPAYPHDQEIVLIPIKDGFWLLNYDVEGLPFVESTLTASDRESWDRFLSSICFSSKMIPVQQTTTDGNYE